MLAANRYFVFAVQIRVATEMLAFCTLASCMYDRDKAAASRSSRIDVRSETEVKSVV